jgi:hypothetical protein
MKKNEKPFIVTIGFAQKQIGFNNREPDYNIEKYLVYAKTGRGALLQVKYRIECDVLKVEEINILK